MSTVMRVFQAEAKPERSEEFRRFFVTEALAAVQSHDGLLSVEVGLPTEVSPHSFCMITNWSSVDSLIGFAGEQWTEAVIDPREAPLLVEARVFHYFAP